MSKNKKSEKTIEEILVLKKPYTGYIDKESFINFIKNSRGLFIGEKANRKKEFMEVLNKAESIKVKDFGYNSEVDSNGEIKESVSGSFSISMHVEKS